MDEPVITHHPLANGGAYIAQVAGSEATGELTYRRTGLTVSADHTLVPADLGGRGIAARLVDALVADARAQGWKIVPACNYVATAFRRHPEWADLLA